MPLKLTVQTFRRYTADDLVVRLSTGVDGTQANGESYSPRFSADGRYVVFTSDANNLVTGDTNGVSDVFRKHLATGQIERVTATADGEANHTSYGVQISADGRYVVFESHASNLVADDINGKGDVFRKDLATGQIVRVSTTADGTEANDGSYRAQVSADGRYLVFESQASNLVANDANGEFDVFHKDLTTGQIVRVSTTVDGIEANAFSIFAQVSSDGRYVVFESSASNLVENDTNGAADIFRKNVLTGQIVRVATSANGTEADGDSLSAQITPDGRYVVFESKASNLVPHDINGTSDVFRKDLLTGDTVRVSTGADGVEGNGRSSRAQISADGRYVLFNSSASNLVAGDTNGVTDVFSKDLVTGKIVRLSTRADGAEADGGSYSPLFNADGSYVAYESDATNLLAGDTNSVGDIFAPNINLRPYQPAILEGRVVTTTFEVGAASKVSVAWGDGNMETVAPTGGEATFTHVYATAAGTKSATVTVNEGVQSRVVPYLIDVPASQMARNTALADTITGGDGADSLMGDAFANAIFGQGGRDQIFGGTDRDRLDGGAGNDRLFGEAGNDTLFGGAGKDVLNGGSGKDVFAFDTKISKKTWKAHRDKIVGYNKKDDVIWLDNKAFKKLGKGTEKKPKKLKKAFFKIGTKAEDKNDYIVFNPKKKVLLYDADGSGKGAAVQFATFDTKVKGGMSHAEFFVI